MGSRSAGVAFCGCILLLTGEAASAQTIQSARKDPLIVYLDDSRSAEQCRVPGGRAVGAKVEEQSRNRMLKVTLCAGDVPGWVRPIDVKLDGTPTVKGDCNQRLQASGLAAGRGLGEGC